MDLSTYEIEVEDADVGLDTLTHIKEPLESLIGCAISLAERTISRDDMVACLHEFMLHVSVGLQMRCPECRPVSLEEVPPGCPTCKGRGWVWKQDAIDDGEPGPPKQYLNCWHCGKTTDVMADEDESSALCLSCEYELSCS